MRIRMLALAATAGLAVTTPASAALLTNGSFEDRVVTAADTCQGIAWCVRSPTSLPGWTQVLDGVDLIHTNYAQGPAVLLDPTDGSNFLDMNQAGALGGIEQVVSGLVAGSTYSLSLDIGGWATNSGAGTVQYGLYDGVTNALLNNQSFSYPAAGTWARQTVTGVATSGSIRVRIEAVHTFQAGPGVDNVVLTGATVVPEPSTWALMIAGFGLAGAALRRRAALTV
jgi:hypothetical protein